MKQVFLFLFALFGYAVAQGTPLIFFEQVNTTVEATFANSTSVGNITWFRDNIFFDAALTSPFGFVAGWCTVTSESSSECEWKVQLFGEDSIFVKGTVFREVQENTLSIIGGTGSYIAASGTASLNSTGNVFIHSYDILLPDLSTLQIITIEGVEFETGRAFSVDQPVPVFLFRNPVLQENQTAGQSIGYCLSGEPDQFFCAGTYWFNEGTFVTKDFEVANATGSIAAIVGGISTNGSFIVLGGEYRWNFIDPITYNDTLILYVKEGNFSSFLSLSPFASLSSSSNATLETFEENIESNTFLIPEDGSIFWGQRDLFFNMITPSPVSSTSEALGTISGEIFSIWGRYISFTLHFPDGILVCEGILDGLERFAIIGGTGSFVDKTGTVRMTPTTDNQIFRFDIYLASLPDLLA